MVHDPPVRNCLKAFHQLQERFVPFEVHEIQSLRGLVWRLYGKSRLDRDSIGQRTLGPAKSACAKKVLVHPH